MPRRSQLDLIWPAAGIDRSLGTQRQAPYSTPDALNVRTEDQREYRQRGGSRPGLGLAIRQLLPPPISLLTKISIIKAKSTQRQVAYTKTALRDTLQAVPWASPPDYLPGTSFQGNVGSLIGNQWGAKPGFLPSVDTVYPYELSLNLMPNPEQPIYEGVAEIYFDLATANQDPSQTGWTAQVSFADGHYQGNLTKRSGGTIIYSTTSLSYDDNPNVPGTMSVRMHGGAIQLFWRNRSLCYALQTMTNFYCSIGVTSADESILVRGFLVEYSQPANEEHVDKNQRQDLLAAVAGQMLWVETTSHTMEYVTSSITFSEDQQLTAVDREQKLYIADFGVTTRGDNGAVTSPYATLTDLGKDFGTIGVTDDYILTITGSDWTQNEKQRVSLYTTDGGTFALQFKGAQTAPIAWNASAATVDAALEALSTIDTVTVTGSDGGPYEVEFTGSLAAQNVEKLLADSGNLTYSGSGTPSIVIDDVQQGLDGSALAGNYKIVGVSGHDLDFDPPLPGTITSPVEVVYEVAKPPKVYNAQTKTLSYLQAAPGKGYAPVGCRLITLYRDRLVLAARDELPHIWYMSRQGDPTDWDYSQEDSGAAVYAQPSLAGQLADPITAMIPHSDECLIFGCYNSLWMLRGDPGYGGTVDQISRKIGIVGPTAWCRTPEDMICFLSPDGLYAMPAGCNGFPTSLSRERLPDELLSLTPDREIVSLEYDVQSRGIHLFVTKLDESESPHWWFDWEAKAWWRVQLQPDHEPTYLHERLDWARGPTVLLACRDGYIRQFDRLFTLDDGGYPIESYCLLGPFHLDRDGFNEGVLAELHAHLGHSSGAVEWEVYTGNGHEDAVHGTLRTTGSWQRWGQNYTARPRARGVSAVVKVKGKGDGNHWFLERLTAIVKSAGRKRVR